MCGHYCFAGFYFGKENNLVSNLYILFHSGIKKYLIHGCSTQRQVQNPAVVGVGHESVECDEFRLVS
jgi:hypothetical protein